MRFIRIYKTLIYWTHQNYMIIYIDTFLYIYFFIYSYKTLKHNKSILVAYIWILSLRYTKQLINLFIFAHRLKSKNHVLVIETTSRYEYKLLLKIWTKNYNFNTFHSMTYKRICKNVPINEKGYHWTNIRISGIFYSTLNHRHFYYFWIEILQIVCL